MSRQKNIYFSLITTSVLTIYTLIYNLNYTYAAELDQDTRTVLLNKDGKSVTLTPEQVKKGKRLFNSNCAQCHLGGITKTNPNIGLDIQSLKSAIPSRDNIESLIDYMKNPTTYDGTESIAQIHPSIKSADLFPKMRNITDEDLFAIAGHILLQSKVVTEKWGGGKIYY
uniref:photosystem II cytochrome c550 n=1 Tax=Galdieria phlegrea TaxID=1389228 RepID=UPI0023D8B978|nr:photosystem II cytochrome c550 [Galdieria phlegrea]WDA99808.1 photosystem II cytochrome c550 [Galdieria phlegrea]